MFPGFRWKVTKYMVPTIVCRQRIHDRYANEARPENRLPWPDLSLLHGPNAVQIRVWIELHQVQTQHSSGSRLRLPRPRPRPRLSVHKVRVCRCSRADLHQLSPPRHSPEREERGNDERGPLGPPLLVPSSSPQRPPETAGGISEGAFEP